MNDGDNVTSPSVPPMLITWLKFTRIFIVEKHTIFLDIFAVNGNKNYENAKYDNILVLQQKSSKNMLQ